MATGIRTKSSIVGTEVFDTYWKFAAERQSIFFRRINTTSREDWTDDPVLFKYKFTNAYRASDRVSQYLIQNVIYMGEQTPDELFFRILLFKFFNRIDTWKLLEHELGGITYADYSFKNYDRVLSKARKIGKRIYSAAYIMPSGGSNFGHKFKHRNNLKLLEMMMKENLPNRLTEVKTMQEVFNLLKSYPTIGDFLAYQYTIDLNYSELINFSEDDFVMPGPGALSGLQKCFSSFGGYTESDLIRRVVDSQEDEFNKRNIDFKSLWGRPLKLIDCQNLFCEVDKYARVKHPNIVVGSKRSRIKQNYKQNSEPIIYWFPPKWKINKKIASNK